MGDRREKWSHIAPKQPTRPLLSTPAIFFVDFCVIAIFVFVFVDVFFVDVLCAAGALVFFDCLVVYMFSSLKCLYFRVLFFVVCVLVGLCSLVFWLILCVFVVFMFFVFLCVL